MCERERLQIASLIAKPTLRIFSFGKKVALDRDLAKEAKAFAATGIPLSQILDDAVPITWSVNALKGSLLPGLFLWSSPFSRAATRSLTRRSGHGNRPFIATFSFRRTENNRAGTHQSRRCRICNRKSLGLFSRGGDLATHHFPLGCSRKPRSPLSAPALNGET
jgi:hypothetical protein